MNKINYYKNIQLNYIFSFVRNMNVTQGIWMIYLTYQGMSLWQVGLLEGIYHVTSFLMETPTGAVADVLGRKISRIVGLVFAIIGNLFMIISGSFIGFAISFMLTALSNNFESGAGEALIYDSLVLSKKETLFMKITGRNEGIFQITGIIALLVGGILGSANYAFVFITAIGISFIALLIAVFFREPVMEKTVKENKTFLEAIKGQYTDSAEVIKGDKKLAYLIVFSSLIGTFITLSFFYLQVGWKAVGYDEWQIGIFLGISSAIAAIGAIIAEKVDNKYGEVNVLKYSPLIIMVSIFGLYFTRLSIISFCVMSFVECITFVATRAYINKLIPSEKRATILSFESTMFSFFMICLFPIFGYISDQIGMAYSFTILGGIMMVLSFINIRFLREKA